MKNRIFPNHLVILAGLVLAGIALDAVARIPYRSLPVRTATGVLHIISTDARIARCARQRDDSIRSDWHRFVEEHLPDHAIWIMRAYDQKYKEQFKRVGRDKKCDTNRFKQKLAKWTKRQKKKILAQIERMTAPPDPDLVQSDSPCIDINLEDYDQVFACMATFRDRKNRNRFASGIERKSCQNLEYEYRHLREEVGLNRYGSVPDCAMFAAVATDIMGEPPWWMACMDFDATQIEQHMGQCLERMIPRYTNRKKGVAALRNCKETYRYYEIGLSMTDPDDRLPARYERPSCEVATALIAEASGSPPNWAGCLGYDPDDEQAHVMKCLEKATMTGHFSSVQQVRSAYEQRMIEAYGGKLPNGYIALKPDSAQKVIQMVKQREEKRREMRKPENRCRYSPPLKVPDSYYYQPESRNFLKAPAKCGDYYIYIDMCMRRNYRAIIGMYTLSTTPPDKITDHINEYFTYRKRIAAESEVLSQGRKIARDKVRWVPYMHRLGSYYGNAVCKPYKPKLSVPEKIIQKTLTLEIPLPSVTLTLPLPAQ